MQKLKKVWKWLMGGVMKLIELGEAGAFNIDGIIDIVIGFVIAGAVIVGLWDTFVGTDTDIQDLAGTDPATVFLQIIWPICLIIGGIYMVRKVLNMARGKK